MKIAKCLLGILSATVLLHVASAHSTTLEVGMSSYSYSPDPATINQGDSIRWVLVSGIQTTTSGTSCTPDGFWNSGSMSSGDTFILPFDTTGSFPYFCTFHCAPYSMTGTIIVQQLGTEEESKFDTSRTKFEILQNHPNPFGGSTIIRYSLTERTQVKIEIFDLSGKRVKTLFNAHQEKGEHQEEWDGKDREGNKAPSGIYFYRLQSGDYTATKNMTLLK